jgi:outer membrane protein insertion porin family
MLVPLLLALAGGPAPPAPSPEEFVREVRIEADHPEALARFVGLVPGRPLDPEAVRHAVELMYATGEFEDVLVEVERPPTGEGIDVVFRPRPAPLLVDVRVEGDHVLSGGALRRAARLRAGEPLWPARLERAGRDAALELARRGHLEALVEVEAVRVPGGADAVFHVKAGPKVHVGSVSISGVRGLSLPFLDDLVRPRSGETFRRDEADKAREAMRRRLARSGRWRAAVNLLERYAPSSARVTLVFHVVAGPQMDAEVRGASVPGGLLDEVRELLREGAVGRDALEAGAERLESYLRRQGHREARVRPRTESSVTGEIVVYDAEPGPRATVASVAIRGADEGLLAGLATRVGDPVRDSDLAADARTLTRRLEESGHFEAEVEPDVAEGGGPLPVVFLARPGPRAAVGAVKIDGPPLPPLPLSAGAGGPPELAVRPGMPYRVRDLATSRETLLSGWRRAGYLDARVDPDPTFSADRTRVDVRFAVEPGPRTLVEDVVLAGLRKTRETTVTRELTLRRGEPFSFERVLESQRRLLGLGIFERVGISELDPQRERRRDVVVRVQEAPRTTVSWGVGYSEQDRLRGSVEVTRRNLSGLGRTASVFARGSFRGSRFLLNLREPWLFGRRLDSYLNAFWEEEDRTTFDYTRKGGILQAGRKVNERTTFLFRYLYQDTNVFNIQIPIEEIDRQFRTYTVSGPAASVVWDSRDDPLEPRRGSFLGADLQLSLDALGGVSFLKGFFQVSTVRPLRSDLLFVVSARVGLAGTFGNAPPLLPLPERYFAGGDYGPRGFPVDEVGPKFVRADGEVFPTGGDALLLGDAELRYNLTRSFQLATFLDLGNVFPVIRDLRLSDLRSSTGLGLRYMTPIGPVRLDWGYVLDRRPGEKPWRFHLTIGHAF